MYKKMRLADTVRIAPELLGEPVEQAVKIALREKLEGLVDKRMGAIVAVKDIIEVGEGHILAGDGGVYYDVVFDALTFMPELQEIIEGSVVEVVQFGIFVGIGPLDGLVHVSQLTDEFVTYDEKNSRLITRESGRSVTEGDRIRARIIAVSLMSANPGTARSVLPCVSMLLERWIGSKKPENPERKPKIKENPKRRRKKNLQRRKNPMSQKPREHKCPIMFAGNVTG